MQTTVLQLTPTDISLTHMFTEPHNQKMIISKGKTHSNRVPPCMYSAGELEYFQNPVDHLSGLSPVLFYHETFKVISTCCGLWAFSLREFLCTQNSELTDYLSGILESYLKLDTALSALHCDDT